MLATGRMVEIGEAVGIIAAQSIGEPGTQLTMRTFHYGGTATRGTESSRHVANHQGKIKFLNVAAVVNKDGETVAISRTGKVVILDERQREKERYSVAYGSHLLIEDGQEVEPGTPLIEWDPFTSAILTAIAGKVKFHDLVEGENVREEIDKLTGHAHSIVIEPLGAGKRIPTLEVIGKGRGKNKETRRYQLPIGSHLAVTEGDDLADQGQPAGEEANARGWKQPPRVQDEDQQQDQDRLGVDLIGGPRLVALTQDDDAVVRCRLRRRPRHRELPKGPRSRGR